MMQKSRTTLFATLVLASAFAVAPVTAQAQYSGIWFFGDSFTDTGNAVGLAPAEIGNPAPSPPYFDGRFSDGPVWSEILAARLGLAPDAGPALLGGGNNFAVGGARTGLTGSFGSLSGMLTQGAVFHSSLPPTGADANGLYVVFGGGNDIGDIATLAPEAQLGAVQQAATNVVSLVGGLYAAGARDFLVPTLPNFGFWPSNIGSPQASSTASALSQTFNNFLTLGLAGFGAIAPDATIFGLTLENLFQNIREDAALGGPEYGLTNTTGPCFLLLGIQADPCASAVFADPIHVTTAVHSLIADAAYDRVINGRDIAVPEPGVPSMLAIAALLGLAVVVRRRVGARTALAGQA